MPYDPEFRDSVAKLQDALASFERCLLTRLSPGRHLRICPPQDAAQKQQATPEAEK